MIYPVHKALIYQEGLKALDVFATIGQRDKMVRGVIDWSWSGLQQRNDPSISPINLALGEAAIEAFRQSLRQSVEYEHQWFDAGMPDVSAWVLEGTEAKPGLMKPAIWRLIQLICQNANHAIQQEEASKDGQKRSSTIPTSTRNIIDQRVSIWAENAHTELRDRLYSAFNSKSWRRIKWWKLFWRVDDVGYIVSDILRRTWLVEAEKEMIWISGRIHQSGLLGPPKLRPEPPPPDPDDERTFGRAPPAPGISDLIERPTNFEVVEDMIVQHPWRQDISHARSALLEVTVPPLQSLSQALLLQTISTNVLASSLSALFYVSVSTTSPYEAGAIAALGFVLSLRRLQRRWELARSEWQTQIREEGRRVLRNIEEVAREPIRDGGMGEADVIGIEERATARQAVDKVQKALEETSS